MIRPIDGCWGFASDGGGRILVWRVAVRVVNRGCNKRDSERGRVLYGVGNKPFRVLNIRN